MPPRPTAPPRLRLLARSWPTVPCRSTTAGNICGGSGKDRVAEDFRSSSPGTTMTSKTSGSITTSLSTTGKLCSVGSSFMASAELSPVPMHHSVLLCSPRWLLKQEVPKVVNSINRQLREKSIKTKVGAFSVLKELVVVLPDCLADHFGSLVPGIEKALNDKSSTSNLKIEALVLTRLVMASHSPSVFHPYIKALSAPILSAIRDRYYKVTTEALRVCGELVRVLRPNLEKTAVDFKPYIGPIYNVILGRLANQDQDQR
ncbi:cullin-associated NEDD8-dissociated protein 1 [Zea mays]|uniref:cullin-associated NEDD8-dissociated protein 1 n=1 Tax=Zea mays TaxID=4577 RepID=UPI0009A97968|nr:cullin-associated NEDD8-dissociated protein 1 [Zea mays]|eukprot:XP_020407588.1 cullin-associated NEDD8-dissociated protein 1 [Zea mays]